VWGGGSGLAERQKKISTASPHSGCRREARPSGRGRGGTPFILIKGTSIKTSACELGSFESVAALSAQ